MGLGELVSILPVGGVERWNALGGLPIEGLQRFWRVS